LMEAEEIFLMFTRAREKLVLLYGPRTKDITLDIYTIKNKEEILEREQSRPEGRLCDSRLRVQSQSRRYLFCVRERRSIYSSQE